MKVVYVVADSQDEWNSAEWRCAIPARAIQKTANSSAVLLGIESFAKNTKEAKDICGPSDLIIVQRNLFGPVLNAVQYWKARDKVVVVDFDDAYNLIPPGVKNYEFWALGKHFRSGPNNERIEARIDPPPLTQFKLGLRLVNAATVPSTTLLNDWCEYAPVYHVPNYIEVDRYSQAIQAQHDDIIIGWGGSLSHLQSFVESGITTALKKICALRPKVKIMICGDQRVFNLIQVAEDQKIFKPWVSAAQWPYQLANFDIGLAPLCGPYDQRRSWIKVLEYLIMKIPWVASEGPAYHGLRPYGWLVPNNTSAWERILFDLVDHIEDYKHEAAQGPYLFGIGQSMDDNVERVLITYSQIIEKAQE